MKKREKERTLYLCLANAASLGGDSDTLACITGGIAEAFYGMPQELRNETLKRLPKNLRAALLRAGAFLQGKSVVY